ncbi:MAG: hypothetical protein QMD46_02690 [Methanomicrobiales archaeon]|nr:hypothetical protein [Methanomicrobiales archaeon]MDI6875347.1 hypothetical protein [Methanomicrobiales archaeon]
MAGRSEYIAAIVVNVVILYIANNLLFWGIPFVTDAWNQVLPVLDLALVAAIVANLIFLAYDPFLLRETAKILLDIFGIAVLYTVYRVFPFDFSSLAGAGIVTLAVRIALILGVAATVVAILVRVVRILFRRPPGAAR